MYAAITASYYRTRAPASQTKTNGCYGPPESFEKNSNFTPLIIQNSSKPSCSTVPTITNSDLVEINPYLPKYSSSAGRWAAMASRDKCSSQSTST